MDHAGDRPRPGSTAAACLTALMTLGGCATASTTASVVPTDPPTSATVGPTAVAPTGVAQTSPPEAILSAFDIGGHGWAMTKAGDALWIQVDPPVDAIVRVDITTGSTLAVAPEGRRVKAGAAGLWVIGGDWLVRLDPASGAEILRVPIGGAFALANGSLWVVNEDGLNRVDAETGAVADLIRSNAADECSEDKDLVVAFKSAWLACAEGSVLRIDLKTGETTKILTGWGAHTFAVLDDAIWVTNYEIGTVSRIDPETNQVTTIEDAGSGVGITSGDGHVWAAAQRGIAKIDPGTSSIVGTVELGWGDYYELVWDAGVIWASTRGSQILRVDPSKLSP